MPTCLPRAHESINDDDASLRDKYRASATDARAARDATTCDVDARRSTARHKRSPSPMAPTDRPVSTRSSHPPSRRHPSTHSRQCAPMFRSMKHLRFRTCRAPRWHRVLGDADGLCAQAHFAGQVAYARRNPTSYHWLTASLCPPDCHALSLQHRARRWSDADRVVVQSRARADLTADDRDFFRDPHSSFSGPRR
jgi:hypothetical protein